MKLEKKKALAARALNIGEGRIIFNTNRLSELEKAITKQDMKDLKESGAIMISEKKGRLTKKKRKTRRRAGSIKKKVNTRKQDYVKLTRKLRKHLSNLRNRGLLEREEQKEIRKKIRAKSFRSLAHMKERLSESQKIGGKKHAQNTKAKKKRSKN